MIYTIQNGDTLEFVAVKFYGSSVKYSLIYEANPYLFARSGGAIGSKDLLIPGEQLAIPVVADSLPPNTEPVITMTINGRAFSLFEGLTITLALDALAHVFAFSVPNDNTLDPFFYEAFLPYSYASVEIFYSGKKIVSGTLVVPQYTDSTIVLQGYSVAGVLQSCNMSPSSYPRQFKEITLTEIASQLCRPFGVSLTVSDGAKEAADVRYALTEIGESDTIASYLIGIAQERGLIIRPNSKDGGIVIDKVSIDGAEVLYLDKDVDPVLDIDISFDGDELFSDYIALSSEGANSGSSQSTERFHIVPVTRPHVITQNDGENDSELRDYNSSEIGRTIRSSIRLNGSHYRWENKNGELFQPGQIITIKSSKMRIVKPTRFLISSVTLSSATSSGRVAQFEFSLADSYDNTMEAFWLL